MVRAQILGSEVGCLKEKFLELIFYKTKYEKITCFLMSLKLKTIFFISPAGFLVDTGALAAVFRFGLAEVGVLAGDALWFNADLTILDWVAFLAVANVGLFRVSGDA